LGYITLNVTNHHATSGIIILTKEPYSKGQSDTWNYTESINGQTTNGSRSFNDPTNTMVNLCPPLNIQRSCLYLTFKVIEPNYVELQGDHKNIIDLVR